MILLVSFSISGPCPVVDLIYLWNRLCGACIRRRYIYFIAHVDADPDRDNQCTHCITKRWLASRRSHNDQPMAPAVIPSGRQQSTSEEVSRPSIQNLIHSASEGGSGRAESVRHPVGDLVSRRLAFLGVGNPGSSPTTSSSPLRSHSGTGSNSNRDTPSNMTSSTFASAAKQHASPSKARIDPIRYQGSLWYGVAQLHGFIYHQLCSTSDAPVVRLMMTCSGTYTLTLVTLANSTDGPWLLTGPDGTCLRFEARSPPHTDIRTRKFRDQTAFPVFSMLSGCLTASDAQVLRLDKSCQRPQLQRT